MDRILIDKYGRQLPCDYRGERYAIRDNGAICRQQRANSRRRPQDGRWTFGTPCRHSGYMKISAETVHRIVATGFHGPAPTKSHVVDHIDTNRRNNRPENLRWVTRLENVMLNPITSRRIVDAYGSIEAFFADPSRNLRGPLDPNFEWMRTVTPDEARATLARMTEWACREVGAAAPLGEWVQRRRPSRTSAASSEDGLNNTKPSLTAGAYQRDWQTPTLFPSCPQIIHGSGLKEYEGCLPVGAVFSTNQYGDTFVLTKGWTVDGSGLLVLTRMPETAQKHWALALITFEGGVFVHANLGSFFSEEGAHKAFTLAHSNEWTGEDSIDDYM